MLFITAYLTDVNKKMIAYFIKFQYIERSFAIIYLPIKITIMEVLRSYELRQCGNQIALRQLTLPEGEMKTVLIADKLVEDHEHRTVNGSPFFALQKAEKLFLCWDVDNNLRIAPACKNYHVHNGDLLLEMPTEWQFWSANDETPQKSLGYPVGSFMELFIRTVSQGFELNYFERGKLMTKLCQECEVLNTEIKPNDFVYSELFTDVVKIKTEEGTFFVSIEKQSSPEMHYMGGSTRSVNYHFVFDKQPLAEFTRFQTAEKQIRELVLQKGLSVAHQAGLPNWKHADIKAGAYKKTKVQAMVYLKHISQSDVIIDVDIERFLHNEKHLYHVRCFELRYAQEADDVRFEKSETENALFIQYDGRTDKIWCEGNSPFKPQNLKLKRNI